MSDIKLGQLAQLSDPLKDAVHVCVVKVIATTELRPGQCIGIEMRNGEYYSDRSSSQCIAIADPFMHEYIRPGQTFYAMMTPGKVGGLNHNWTSDYLEEPSEDDDTDWDDTCRHC